MLCKINDVVSIVYRVYIDSILLYLSTSFAWKWHTFIIIIVLNPYQTNLVLNLIKYIHKLVSIFFSSILVHLVTPMPVCHVANPRQNRQRGWPEMTSWRQHPTCRHVTMTRAILTRDMRPHPVSNKRSWRAF